jgi:hypothetical protein
VESENPVLATLAIRSEKRRLNSVGVVVKQALCQRMSHVASTGASGEATALIYENARAACGFARINRGHAAVREAFLAPTSQGCGGYFGYPFQK